MTGWAESSQDLDRYRAEMERRMRMSMEDQERERREDEKSRIDVVEELKREIRDKRRKEIDALVACLEGEVKYMISNGLEPSERTLQVLSGYSVWVDAAEGVAVRDGDPDDYDIIVVKLGTVGAKKEDD